MSINQIQSNQRSNLYQTLQFH